MTDVYDESENVASREDLSAFVMSLVEDFRQNRDGWENWDLEDYLESVSAWLHDCDGLEKNTGFKIPEQPDWKFVATILMAGKFYQ